MDIKPSAKGPFKSFCYVPAKVYKVISRSTFFFLDVIEMYVIFFQGKHLHHTRDKSFFFKLLMLSLLPGQIYLAGCKSDMYTSFFFLLVAFLYIFHKRKKE